MSAASKPQSRPRDFDWTSIRRHHETTAQMMLRFGREVRDLAHEMQLDADRPSGERTIAALFLEALGEWERKAR